MNTQQCPGLLAEMPHQWLAAVGAVVMAEDLRLSWTDEPSPCAVLHSSDAAPADGLAAVWPEADTFAAIPIVEWNLNNKQDIPLADYRRMTRDGIRRNDAWTLAAAATDLSRSDKNPAHAARGPFNPGFQGVSSPQRSILKMVSSTRHDIAAALGGRLEARKGDGLGLDPDRFTDPSSRDTGVTTVHPVEVLAYYGLALFPVRGDGVIELRRPRYPRQRGWTTTAHRAGFFQWPAWRQPLDRWGIDALLDAWSPDHQSQDDTLGVIGAWSSVRIDRPGKNPGHGYASQRLHLSPEGLNETSRVRHNM